MSMTIKCRECGKTPAELQEYVDMAEIEGYESAEEAAKTDGTYNPSTGLFYCTECYINVGMPLGKA
jgi:hypothetical protein